MYRLVLIVGIVIASFGRESMAAEMHYAITSDNRLFIELEGDIVQGDAAKFSKFIHSDLYNFSHAEGLALNSRGGSLVEATKIGQIVEKAGLRVDVPKDSTCASACFFIYISAPVRYSDGSLIVHRPYFDMTEARGAEHGDHEMLYRKAILQARDYLSARSVPGDLIDMMMTKSSADGYVLTNRDVIRISFFSPAVDEYQIQRCGLLADRVMSKEEISLLNRCRKDFLRASKMRYMFGDNADLAMEAFANLRTLSDHYKATDPEFRLNSREYSARLRAIVNSSPPNSWVERAKKAYTAIAAK